MADGPRVIVYARQRTGSTWLRSLLLRNLADADVSRLHSTRDLDADAYFVIMRDPWAWLVSFYRFQVHPIFGFVDRAWNRVMHPPVDRFRAFRWWDMYLLSYELWERTLPEDRTAWLKYEELIPDPTERLGEAIAEAGLEPAGPIETDPTRRTDFSNPLAKILSPEALGTSTFDPTYYTEKRYLEAYRPDHMRTLLEMARGRGLAPRFERFGYDLAEDVPEDR